MLLVLWALGWSMIVLSVPGAPAAWFVTAFGVAMIAGHNLLDGVRSTQSALVDPARAGIRAEYAGACRVHRRIRWFRGSG